MRGADSGGSAGLQLTQTVGFERTVRVEGDPATG